MRLKQLRKERKLKQSDVASVISCSQAVYSRYERGEREPSNDTLSRLADYYGVTVDYILGRDDPDPAPVSPAPPEPLVKMVVLDPNPPDLSSVDFTDPAIQAKLLKPGNNYSPEAAAIIAELMAKIMRLTPEQLTQAEAFVSFLENQQKE